MLEAEEPLFRGRNVTLTFTYTDPKTCAKFDWKMYASDWINILPGDKYQMFERGNSRLLTIINSSDVDIRNYAVQCCDMGFSNIVSLKLPGKDFYEITLMFGYL